MRPSGIAASSYPSEERMRHLSQHWTNGGTGLTNFPPEDFQRFQKAVDRFGSDKFLVSEDRMIGRGAEIEGGSLHYLGPFRTEAGNEEIHKFWRVFDAVTAELKAAA